MKLRFGFVSNSSSTSFCVFGARLGHKVAMEAMKRCKDISERDLDNSPREALEQAASRKGISLKTYVGDYEWYVGLDWGDMHMDETRAQFEARVRTAIEGLFPGVPFELEHIDEEVPD